MTQLCLIMQLYIPTLWRCLKKEDWLKLLNAKLNGVNYPLRYCMFKYKCNYVCKSGKNKGKECGKKCYDNSGLCSKHSIKLVESSVVI